MKVAFLGLGKMGLGMAGNLLKAGHQVTVWNRTQSRGADLARSGAKLAGTPAEAARDAEVAFTMLADDPAAREVVFGQDGVLEALPRGAVHVSSSTISVQLSDEMEQEHNAHAQKYISAPVFGRPEAAAAAKLFIVAAGEADIIKYCEPLLSVLGQRTFVLGDKPSMANVVKLSGNFLIATIVESFGEAIALIRKYGVDPHQYLEMLTSSLFTAPVHKTYGGLIVDQKFEPAGFMLKLGLKDTRLVLQAGDAVNAPLPIASVIRDHFLEAMADGMAEKDWSSLSLVAARNAGLK